MESRDWAGMFKYGLAILAVLILALGDFSQAEQRETVVEGVELVEGERRNVSFDEEALQVTISGKTTVSGANASLAVNSTDYRNGTLEVDIRAISLNLSRAADFRQLNYTLTVAVGAHMPERVLVHGASERTQKFTP
jgi:hypothetical protein